MEELIDIPPRQTMLLHIAVYNMLHGIIDYTEEVMGGVPDEFGRSMAKMLINSFFEKYEQKRLEKAAEAQARMEQNPEAAKLEVSLNPLITYISFSNFYVSPSCRKSYFVKEDDVIPHEFILLFFFSF